MAIVIPFDNNPSTITIKTSPYTIPVNKYAKVTPIHPDFTLNGTLVYGSHSLTAGQTPVGFQCIGGAYVTGSVSNNGFGGGNGSVGAGYFYAGNSSDGSYLAGFTVISRGSIGAFTPAMIYAESLFAKGDAFSGTNVSVTYYTFTGAAKEFWLPAGTVLGGSKYVVTEYNAIT